MAEKNSVKITIPYTQLSAEAMSGVVDEFILREGTDYGGVELSYETKFNNVISLLKSKEVEIVFDPESESCTIVKVRT